MSGARQWLGSGDTVGPVPKVLIDGAEGCTQVLDTRSRNQGWWEQLTWSGVRKGMIENLTLGLVLEGLCQMEQREQAQTGNSRWKGSAWKRQ